MEPLLLIGSILLSVLAVALIKAFFSNSNGKNRRLPPSPPGLPVIGHLLYLLSKPLHGNLTRLAKKYGDVILLRIGARSVLVVSSASAAEQCLIQHDVIFANRPPITAGKIFGFNYTTIGFTSYGPHYTILRRTVAMEIMSTQRMNQLSYIRLEEVKLVAKEMAAAAGGGFKKAEMTTKLTTLTFNIMMRMVMGVKAEKGDPEAEHFIENFGETGRLAGTNFPGDFIPVLKLLDMGRFEGKLIKVRNDRNRFLRRIIQERSKIVLLPENQGKEMKCLADFLIKQQEIDPEYYNEGLVLGTLSFMLTAGADTSAITMEWALSLLINHPDVFQKVRAEVESRTGHGVLVTEQDIPHLPFLQAVIFETLRLYPALPLLFPHATSEDCVINGYDVPAGTMVFLDVPAIHRDETLWEEPDKFKPERFLNKPELVSKAGGGCKFIPFSAGRRRCPGEGLGLRTVGLTLATLVQCFDWKSVDGKELDMEEESGLTMPKKVPLEAMYKVREFMLPALD